MADFVDAAHTIAIAAVAVGDVVWTWTARVSLVLFFTNLAGLAAMIALHMWLSEPMRRALFVSAAVLTSNVGNILGTLWVGRPVNSSVHPHPHQHPQQRRQIQLAMVRLRARPRYFHQRRPFAVAPTSSAAVYDEEFD